MRNKKLVSTVVASALIATTMAMPVMAADTGKVEVDVTTKNAVIRVEVPTALEIAVDQFESVDSGVQIYSAPFTMKNKSGVGVKVDVESEATVTGAALVATTAAVDASTATTGAAWLAVAAQTEAGKYGAEKPGDLTEANANVTTFDATSKKASQKFYLAKGDGTVEYKVLAPTAAGKVGDISYAQFYKLTDKTSDVGTGTDNDAKQTNLNNLLAAGDVYVGTVAAADGSSLTLKKKGETHTYDAAEFYYTADPTATAAGSVATTDKYVYAGTATVGGQAAFRYIGKLSAAKTGGWSKTDISKVVINYTLEGVGASTYEEAAKSCTYGLYTTPVAPSIATADLAEKTLVAATAVEIPVNLGAGALGAKTVSSVKMKQMDFELMPDGFATFSNGKVTLTANLVDILINENLVPDTIVITVDDEAGTSFEINLKK